MNFNNYTTKSQETIQMAQQIAQSFGHNQIETVFIFKHSTRCGISSMVLKQFEKLFSEEHQHLKVYYLDLLNYRNISDEIGYTFQVMHQSPQLLIIKNSVSIYDAAHYDIIQTDLSRFM